MFGSGLAASLGIFIPFAHLAPYSVDEGFSDGFGAFLIGMIGVGSIAGRLLLGSSADRLGRRTALIGTFVGMGLCSAGGWSQRKPGRSSSLLSRLERPTAVSWRSCPRSLLTSSGDEAFGVLYSSAAIGALFGPTLSGAIYDSQESYTLPISIAIALNGVAVICVGVIRPPPTRPQTV